MIVPHETTDGMAASGAPSTPSMQNSTVTPPRFAHRPGPAVARWLAWIISAASALIRCRHRRPGAGAAVASRTPKALTRRDELTAASGSEPRRTPKMNAGCAVELWITTLAPAPSSRRRATVAPDRMSEERMSPTPGDRHAGGPGPRRPRGGLVEGGLERRRVVRCARRRPASPWLRTFHPRRLRAVGPGLRAPPFARFLHVGGVAPLRVGRGPGSARDAAPVSPRDRPSASVASARPSQPPTVGVPWNPSRRRGIQKPAGEPRAMPIEPYIDAHSHIWTPDVAHYPLAAGFTVDDMKPPSFTAEELLAICRPSGRGPGQPDPDELSTRSTTVHARHDQALPRPIRRHGDRRPARPRTRPRRCAT